MLTSDFAESFRDEHRQLRDVLLALKEALEIGDSEGVQQGLDELAATAGPHLSYEGEALFPALAGLYGDEYVDRLHAEHEQTLAAARELAELAELPELSPAESARAMELIGDLLPHVSERDGLAVIIEVLPPKQLGAIMEARERARKKKVTVHEASRRHTKRGASKRAAPRTAATTRKREKPAARAKPRARAGKKTARKRRAR